MFIVAANAFFFFSGRGKKNKMHVFVSLLKSNVIHLFQQVRDLNIFFAVKELCYVCEQ